jgi:uncharacterized RDD family membrane protein YckC
MTQVEVDSPTPESKIESPYAELWIRGLAAVIEALVFMALSIPVAFGSPLLLNRMDASSVLPGIPGYFFMEGLTPAVSIPMFAFCISQQLTSKQAESTITIWMVLIGFLVITNLLYHAIMESSRYQGTLGKIIVGMKVTNAKGERLSFLCALIRHLARLLSMLPLFAGYLMILRTKKKQALHDIISGAVVVKTVPQDAI